MKGLTPKIDNDATGSGELTAAEFNDMRNDAQNVVLESGQTLTALLAEDNRQLMKAVAVGGNRTFRAQSQTAEVGEIVLPDTTLGNISINLPDPTMVEVFENATVDFEQIVDRPYSEDSLTILRNGQLIMGETQNFILDTKNADNSKIRFIWKAGTIGWSVNLIGEVAESIP